MVTFYFAFVILLAGVSNAAQIPVKNYSGYKVLRILPSTESQYEALLTLHRTGTFDFWEGPSKTNPTDIMVDPILRPDLENFLRRHDISYNTFIDDVGRVIAQQRATKLNREGMHWDDYQTLGTIYSWLDEIVSSHPNLVTITTIGKSTEGRDIKILKISTGGSQNKTAFWIDGTIHAREWISAATVTYIINELVTQNTNYADLFNVLDFYILPIINPDGYVYSHTVDRMWRKTRSNHGHQYCYGVDANRNFGFHFGGPGSSGDKCDERYRGPEKYSEPEALAVKNYIVEQSRSVKWDTYLTVHSYSQLWLTPWGYTEDAVEDYGELKQMGEAVTAELTSHYGTQYKVGSSAEILAYSSGSSRDWAKGEGGFKWVYTIELRDTGHYGFLLPKEQIIPTAIETWAGIQVLAKHYLK